MSPLRFVTRPVRHLTRAVLLPFQALFVVGLCFAINAATSPGHWWFRWVALGMGIAVGLAWLRAARTLLVFGLVAAVGLWVHRRYGAEAKARFDAWAARTQPTPPQGRAMPGGATGSG